MTSQRDGVREILKEWYPTTLKGGWGDHTQCPCDQCRDYRITQAETAIREIISEENAQKLEGLREKISDSDSDNDYTRKLSRNLTITDAQRLIRQSNKKG